jgi:hypothetical protein
MGSWKDTVRVATTGNITLSGAQTIDGVAVVAGNRVLVKDQATASANGIYVAAAGPWGRSADASSTIEPEMVVRVSEGSRHAHTEWALVTPDSISVGSTVLRFAKQTLVFNIRDYGAAGDGSTDDAPKVAAALRAMGDVDTTNVPGNRGRLYFPPGNYRFATPVRVELRCDIEGATGGGVTITCDDWSSGFIFHAQFNSPTGGAADASRIWNIDFIGGPKPSTISSSNKWAPGESYSAFVPPSTAGSRILPGNVAVPNPDNTVTRGYSDSPYSWEYYYECIRSTGDGKSAAVTGVSGGTFAGLAFEDAHPWLPNHVESVNQIVKIPGQDHLFFACTAVGGSATTGADPSVFAGRTAGAVFTENGGDVTWTAFATNEPDWSNVQGIDDSQEWTPQTEVVFGNVVRVTDALGRADAVFMCKLPALGASPETTGATDPPADFNDPAENAVDNSVFGDEIEEGSITWQCWPTGAEPTPAAWEKGTYARGDKVTSTAGRRYVCVTGGATGGDEPFPAGNATPTPAFTTVPDGDVVWRAYDPMQTMVLDGDLVWACRASNAIRLMTALVEVANCNATNFPNAGVHIQADSASVEPGLGLVPPANCNQFVLRKVRAEACGVGVLTRGGDANAGAAYDVAVTGATLQRAEGDSKTHPEELGIADRAFLGNRWYSPMVEAVGGPGFWVTSGASSGTLVGGYFEATGHLDIQATSYTVVGGTPASIYQIFGLPVSATNITTRSTFLGLLPADCRAITEAGTIADDNRSVQFHLGSFVMDVASANDRWYAWVWNRGSDGFWTHEYTSNVLAAPLALSSASSSVGSGLIAFPRGHYNGGIFADRYYTFPSVDASRDSTIAGAARNVGDRRVRNDLAAPGRPLEQVVTVAGFEAPTWIAGPYLAGTPSGPFKSSGNVVAPRDTANVNRYLCIVGGDSTVEPTWSSAPDLDDEFTDADGLQWRNVGVQAVWTDCNRIRGGQVELDVSSGNHTLSDAEAAFDILKVSNASAPRTITFPTTPSDDAQAYQRAIRNGLTGSGTLTVGLAAGTTVTIAAGKTAVVGFEAAGAFRVTADV